MAGVSLKQRREKKLDECRDLLVDAQADAAKYLRAVQAGTEEAGVRWADRTILTHANMALVDSTFKDQRTKTVADSQRQLGLVMVPVTIASADAWEKYAIEAQKKEVKYIDVESVPDGE